MFMVWEGENFNWEMLNVKEVRLYTFYVIIYRKIFLLFLKISYLFIFIVYRNICNLELLVMDPDICVEKTLFYTNEGRMEPFTLMSDFKKLDYIPCHGHGYVLGKF